MHDVTSRNMAIEHYVIRHNPRFAVGGSTALSSRKRHPTLALHIGARNSSTVSSLFTVCMPECAMLGPAHAANFLSCAPCTTNLSNQQTNLR